MLYHSEVYFPEKLKAAIPQSVTLAYSGHALRACLNDRYGYINGPRWIDTTKGHVFEAEVINGKLVKFCIRMSYDALHDISIVVAHDTQYVVKTLWLNRKTDKHRTLDKNKYAQVS